jgi:photosystem II stability/assembly factor-like uncharacterized protein
LFSIYFTDVNTGYAVGDTGTILKTINGGATWIKDSSGTTIPLTSVFFPNANVGYAVGWWGIILKTINAGITWTTLYDQESTFNTLNTVFFINADTGYIAGDIQYGDGPVVRTLDGGQFWYLVNNSTINDVQSIYFPNPTTGYAVCDNGVIEKSIDGGNDWLLMTSGTTNMLMSVYFTDSDTGYTVGDNGTILKTTDGGGFFVGLNDLSPKSNQLKIYPNPAKDKCNVQCACLRQVNYVCDIRSIEIFNLTGEKVYGAEFSAGTMNSVEVDLDFPAGVYFVRLTSDKDVEVGKLVRW